MPTTSGPISITDPRIANEVERRVAQRTAELTAMNEELRKQVSERRQVEKNPYAQELLLGSMIEGLPVPIGIMTARGECETVNRPVLDYTGKTLEELKLWTMSDIVHVEDRAAAVAAWDHALESGQPYQIETRLRRADGAYRWHNVHTFPMRDANGQILRWLVIQLDVHDRRNPEVLLNSFVESIAAPVTLCAPTGEMVAVNRFGQEYHRKSAEEIMNWTSGDMIFAADLPRVKAAWQRSIETGEPYNVEVRARRAHGPYRWMHSHGFPVRDADGRIIRWCVLHLDIHDNKEAAEALALSERNLKLTIDTIPAMAWSADTGGNVEFFNKNFLDYVGLPPEQMQNGGWQGAVHPDDLERLLATWKKVMSACETGEAEARLRRSDGTYRWFLMRVSPLLDAAANVITWYGVNTDVDDWRKSQLMLSSMVDSIAAPLGFFTPTGELEVVNRLVLDYFGTTFEEVSNWENIVHPDDLAASRAAWNRSMETGEAYQHEARIRRADGSYRWNDHRGYPMRDADGRIVRWCVLQTDIHDRKQTEARLAASERNLDQIINGIPGLAWTAHPDGNAEFLNQHYLDYIGLSLDEARGAGWVTAVHPDDLAHLIGDWQAMMTVRRSGESEARLRRHDGQYRWFLFRTSPVLDDAGNVVRWFGANTDIEDQKRAETALRASEAALAASERKLNLIINTIPVLVWSNHPDGSADFVNQHYLDYLGLTMDQVRDKGWAAAAIHPDDVPHMVATWNEILASRRGGEAEARLRRFDGAYRWFLCRTNPLHDDVGNVVGWFGANIDIEDRKRVEEVMRASELNLRRLTETIPQMLWSATADGAIDYCNTRLLDFTGFTAEQAMGTGWATMLHPDDVEPAVKAWLRCIATGDPYQVEVRTLRAADRTYRWLLTSALPLRDEAGRILKWHGSCVDMHDWKQAQDELRDTQAELAHMTRVMTMGHLTASIAHELNQPLAGIITNASTCMRMLAADPPNVTGARETARRTIRDGNRAAEVIARLRALFSKKNTAIEAVDLNTATQEVIALTLTELQRASVNLRVELADELPFVKGDRVQLQQVIMNLILNAVEAMDGVTDRPKELVIATERDGADHVRVTVQDAGAGFDSTTAEKLFNPFYTTKSHGMGIGLSVSRSIVENHQGRLWAQTNDGPGATFLVSIPSRPDRSGAAGQA